MKIASFEVEAVGLPNDDPLTTPPDFLRTAVTLRLRTADGIEGIGVTFYGACLTGALKLAVGELAALTVGEDPLRQEGIARKLHDAASCSGPAGIFLLAVAAIDLALWDIRGKAAGQPLWQLLGSGRTRVPAYASTMLRREAPLDQLEKTARRLVEAGYREMKMQLALPGDGSPRRELDYARRVRDAVGPDVTLMCDINQRWRVEQAIDLGRRLEEVGFAWLEDVTAHDDYAGLARVAAALATPVCGGECLYGITPFRHMLEARSVDIVMIDLWRVGGITPWLKIAGMAQAFNLPVVSHLFPEVHLHLIAATPNGLTVEYAPWVSGLFLDPPKPVRGAFALPTAPGLGLAFDEAAIRRHRLA